MNPNGQLFSLDFLLAMGLVILLFGTVIAFGEHQTFESHEANQRAELSQIGQNAVVFLVSNPNTTCTLYANGTSQMLNTNVNNCLDWTKITGLSATGQLSKEIGLPANELGSPVYGVYIQTEGYVTIGSSPAPSVPAVFSLDFNAVIRSGNVDKSDVYACIKKQACPLTSKAVSMQIWKN